MAIATGEGTRSAVLLALLAAAAPASAAEVSLTAEVDRTEIGLDETVLLRVRLEAPERPSRWDFPGTPDFEVLVEAPSQERSVSLGGGAGMIVRQTFVIARQLRPTRAGSLTIPPVAAVVMGRRYSTQPIAVRVVAAGAPDGPTAPAGNPGYRGWEKDLSFQVEVDRKEAYLGQQLTAAFWLFTRAEEMVCDAVPPRFDGFWKEDLETPQTFQPQDRLVDGIPTRAYLIQRVALFPTRTGDLTIDPMELPHIRLRLGTRGLLLGGFDDVVTASRRSAPVTIHVKPLPPGAPAGFDPASVGTLALAASATPMRVAAGEPITFRVSITGDGNVRALKIPSLPPFPGVRSFQPTTSDRAERRDRRLIGTRTLETVLVPEREGEVVIEPLDWPYFDPRSGKYQVIHTPEIKVAVVPAAARAAGPTAPGSNPLEARIRPIRSDARLSRRGPPAWQAPWFLALLLAPPLAFLSVAALRRLRGRADGERARRGAARTARRRIAAARRGLARGEGAAGLAELERALVGYASDRLERPAAGLTREELSAELARAGAHPPARRALLRALELVDASRYGAGDAQGEEVLAAAERAIETLEEADWQPDLEVAS